MQAEDFPEHLGRHRGLFELEHINRLQDATVAIAGVGGVGGRVAEVLTRSGVGHLRLADPDTFSTSNLNRQAGSTVESVGQAKVDVVGDLCRSVSPSVEVSLYPEGINPANIRHFMQGADVVVDGTDYTIPSLGLRIANEATNSGVPVVLGVEIGYGVWHTVFTRTGQFERLMGLPKHADPDALDSGELSIPLWRWVQRLPPYIDTEVLKSVERGDIEAPAIGPAVELSAALLCTDVLQLLLGRRPVAVAPKAHGVDVRSGKSWVRRPSKRIFFASALRATYFRAE